MLRNILRAIWAAILILFAVTIMATGVVLSLDFLGNLIGEKNMLAMVFAVLFSVLVTVMFILMREDKS